MNKILFVLIGLKGSGKSYIGMLLQRELDIEFFHVEDVWIKLKGRKFLDKYIQKGFSQVEQEINYRFSGTNKLIIETTAAHEESLNFIARLKKRYEVKLIKIKASPEICLRRIKSRDQSIHIPVSDDRIEEINSKSNSTDLPFDLVIDNERTDDEKILKKFHRSFES